MVCLDREIVSSYVTDALARARQIASSADAFASSDFRSQVSKDLADMLKRMSEAIASGILREWEDFRDDPGDPGLGALQNWDTLSRNLASHLRYLHGSIGDRVPGTLSRALDILIAQLSLPFRVLLREKWAYNYAVDLREVVSQYRDSLSGALPHSKIDEIFRGVSKDFFILAFPALEKNSILLHAALGHEIGHILTENWLLSHDDQDANVDARIIMKVSPLAERNKEREPLTWMTQVSGMVKQVRTARRRFLQELGADYFGLRLFGPAALFAMSHIAVGRPLDIPPKEMTRYYPPWRLRLKFAFEALDERTGDGETGSWTLALQNEPSLKLDEFIGPINDRIRAIRRISSEESTLPSHWDELVRIAYESACEALPALKNHLRAEALREYPSEARILAEAALLGRRIRDRLPPNDVALDGSYEPEPPQLAAILIAAWFYRVGKLETPTTDVSSPDFIGEIDILHRLVAKAIDDTVLLKDFAAWSENDR